MKRNYARGITYAALIILSGCGKDPVTTTPTTTTTSNDPKDGSQWVYKFTYYNQDGSVKGSGDVTYTAKEISYQNSTWLLVTTNQTAITKLGDTAIVAQKRDDGIYWIDKTNGQVSMWIKHPASKGDNYLSGVGDGTTDTVKVQETNATVTVPAGDISGCYVCKQYDTNSLEGDEWYHPEKWLIKHIEYDQDANNNLYKDYMMELVSFTR
ncbi:MAG: hypothetical protein KDC07_05970 [Chitinophagaceae bacterium]|nr:hypothetical protein [Chitinophagaceae bacterium]MCB9045718.1 hypothetical protein [Chitinophagales bacterium]